MRRIIQLILVLLFLFLSFSFAQQKSRAVSAPGKIGKKVKTTQSPSMASELLCTVSFREPSGDNVLGEGESGSIIVEVKNQSHSVIEPKLEISIQSSWLPKPRFSVKWMDDIKPGDAGVYTSKVNWDERLPSGSITYKAKVTDLISELTSEQARVSFNILGSGTVMPPPDVVDVDKNIPRVLVSNVEGIAVIIGNKTYSNPDVPDVDYALNDARIMKQYLINILGFEEKNIMFIENAKKADFETIFGTKEFVEGKLYNWVKPNESDVFIYYSGHGAPDMKNNKAYIMPSNCDPNYVQIGGYPLEFFYQNLTKVRAKSITIILDACFSGGSQQGMLVKNASPMYIDVEMPLFGEKYSLFTSAAGDQISSWYPEGNHSLFTYYFLRALRGEADKDRNRKITLDEIGNFIDEHVPYMARRLYGREQTPVIKGNLNTVISTL